MDRFFGMMPVSEIEITKNYKDQDGLGISIDAGKNGWTVRWADHSSNYKDVVATAEENFKEAYNSVIDRGFELTEVESEPGDDVMDYDETPEDPEEMLEC